MDDPGYGAIDDARVWLRTHWQLIAAPLLTLAIIAGASIWLRPKAGPSGPVNVDNPAGIVEVRELLRSLGAEGRTIFVSSHILSEVQQTADHVAIVIHPDTLSDASDDEHARADKDMVEPS